MIIEYAKYIASMIDDSRPGSLQDYINVGDVSVLNTDNLERYVRHLNEFNDGNPSNILSFNEWVVYNRDNSLTKIGIE